jgi:CheY-like chemotaxis protein
MGRNILLLDHKDTPWIPFFSEYFEDTGSQLHFFHEPAKAAAFLELITPDIIFLNAPLLTRSLVPKIKVLRQSHPNSRLFHLGPVPKQAEDLTFDDAFVEPLALIPFQKQLAQHLILPDHLRILVIDDEPEVGTMMREYLEHRTQPSFKVHWLNNGREALALLKKEKFDVIVLDIKMPEMNGMDVYRELKKASVRTPVIIYFDAIFGDEMVEVHKIGRPAIVEKGSGASTMPEMMALLKKMVYFG